MSDPNSSQAKLLANAGGALVAASLEDTAAIAKALEGATSLVAMTMPSGGTGAETRHKQRNGVTVRDRPISTFLLQTFDTDLTTA